MAVLRTYLLTKVADVAERLKLKLFYLDDGAMGCSPADGRLLIDALCSADARLAGVFLRPDKCEYYYSDATEGAADHFPADMQIDTFDNAFIMGVPLGSEAFSQSFLRDKLAKRLPLLQKLRFLQPLTALNMLRTVLGTCRILYWLRTVPPGLLTDVVSRFDHDTEQAITEICGDVPISPTSLQAIRLHQRIFAASDLAAFAYDCSRFDFSKLILECTRAFTSNTFATRLVEIRTRLAEELGEEPDDLAEGKTQSRLTSMLSRDFFTNLNDKFPPQQRDHWEALLKAQGNEWFRAYNSPDLHIFPDVPLRRDQQRVQLQLMYRLPMKYNGDLICSGCQENLGSDEDRARHHIEYVCKAHNQKSSLHNSIRDSFYELVKLAGLPVDKEKAGLLDANSLKREGDIVIYKTGGPTWLVDFTTCQPGKYEEAEEKKFHNLGFFKGLTVEEKSMAMRSMRNRTDPGAVPPLIPLPDNAEEDDSDEEDGAVRPRWVNFALVPVAIDHAGNFARFAKFFVQFLAESLSDRYCINPDYISAYIKRFVNRLIAYHVSDRILATLRHRSDPDLRRLFYKSLAAAKSISRQRDRKRRGQQQLADSTLLRQPTPAAPTAPVEPLVEPAQPSRPATPAPTVPKVPVASPAPPSRSATPAATPAATPSKKPRRSKRLQGSRK
jgi:hypothetical protein